MFLRTDDINPIATTHVEAIYEPRFLNCMYGFRLNRGCHDAIKEVHHQLQNEWINYVYMEIEYAVAVRYRNNGYAMQAVQRMLDYGFKEMNLSAIAAWVRSHNKESIKVLEKCSFTYEGRLRKHAIHCVILF